MDDKLVLSDNNVDRLLHSARTLKNRTYYSASETTPTSESDTIIATVSTYYLTMEPEYIEGKVINALTKSEIHFKANL